MKKLKAFLLFAILGGCVTAFFYGLAWNIHLTWSHYELTNRALWITYPREMALSTVGMVGGIIGGCCALRSISDL